MRSMKPKTKYHDHWLHANGWDDEMLYVTQQFGPLYRIATGGALQAGEVLYAIWCDKERPLPAVKHPISDEFRTLIARLRYDETVWQERPNHQSATMLYENTLKAVAHFVSKHADKIVWRD